MKNEKNIRFKYHLKWTKFIFIAFFFFACQKEHTEIWEEKQGISLQEAKSFFENAPRNERFLIEPQWKTFQQGGKNNAGEYYAYIKALINGKDGAQVLFVQKENTLVSKILLIYSEKNIVKELIVANYIGQFEEGYYIRDNELVATIKDSSVPKKSAFFMHKDERFTNLIHKYGEEGAGCVFCSHFFLTETVVTAPARPRFRIRPPMFTPNFNASPDLWKNYGGTNYDIFPYAGGGIGAPLQPKDPPKTPCEKLYKIGQSSKTIEKMKELQTKTKENKEIGYILESNSSEMITHYIEGNAGEGRIEFSLTKQIDGVIHSHYQGLLSVFSVSDIFGLVAMYKNGNIRDLNTFVMGLVTDAGTQYMMVIDAPEKFAKFANNLFDENGINEIMLKAYETIYQDFYKISPINSSQLNESSFVNYLKVTGSGLKLMKGDKNMTNWKVLEKDNNGNLTEKKCN